MLNFESMRNLGLHQDSFTYPNDSIRSQISGTIYADSETISIIPPSFDPKSLLQIAFQSFNGSTKYSIHSLPVHLVTLAAAEIVVGRLWVQLIVRLLLRFRLKLRLNLTRLLGWLSAALRLRLFGLSSRALGHCQLLLLLRIGTGMLAKC